MTHPAPRWPWASLLLLVTVLALAYAPPPWADAWSAALALRHDAWLSQPWRWWTAPLVHFGRTHALMDGVGLLLAGALLEGLIGTRRWCVGLLMATLLLSLFILVAEPGLREYRGASGLVVMLLVASGLALWWRRRLPRAGLLLAGAVLLAKLGWDVTMAVQGGPASTGSLPDGVRLAWSAHVGGALLGLGWGWWLRAASRPRR